MGMFNSKEWAEVYNNGQPGSPNDEAEANKENGGDGAKAKNRVLRVDPRSISDDVERTPIQVDKAKKGGFDTPTPDTPTGIKTNVNRFKSTIDPRSPSGLPRTPILVQDKQDENVDKDEVGDQSEDVKEVEVPKRGATKPTAPVPLNDDDVEEVEDQGEETAEQEVVKEVDIECVNSDIERMKLANDDEEEEKSETESVEDENQVPDVGAVITPTKMLSNGNSLPKVPLTTGLAAEAADCRSPLLIENEENGCGARIPDAKSRTPLKTKDDNVIEDEAASMINDIINDSIRDLALSDQQPSGHEDSLVI